MAKYLELISGCMLDVEDIIYIGEVKQSETILDYKYTFNIIWAHRVYKDMVYDDRDTAIADQSYLKKYIKNMY